MTWATVPRDSTTSESDVVVAGGGMAGLCAAALATERGARVLVLEKGPALGGSMAISNGNFALFADRSQAARLGAGGNGQLQKLVLDQARARIDWLRSLAIQVDHLGLAFDAYDLYRTTPATLRDRLAERITTGGGEIITNTRLKTLHATSSGAVTGITVLQADQLLDIDAQSVILATGGFQGEPQLTEQYLGEPATHAYHRANPFSTGDGMLSALAVGAELSGGMHTFYGHAMPAGLTIPSNLWAALTQYYGSWSVAINLDGRRFVDESVGVFEENVNFALAQQRESTGFYILDSALSARTIDARIPPPSTIIDEVRAAGGTAIEASSLEELVDRLSEHGVPPGTALSTLLGYDNAVASGEGSTLEVPRSSNHARLAAAPFTAVKVTASMTMTTGGLAVDESMRVLRSSAAGPAAIRGLFAAGADVGGISHHGYFGGLPTALVTGCVAARAATTAAEAA